MKKVILIAACATMFAVTTYAQIDTTKGKSQTPQQTNPQSDRVRNEDQSMKGWTRVETNDVPASLRTTLGDSQYKGWESGTIYRNQAGDSYQLRTNGNNSKSYYFDKNGKASKKPNN